MASSSAYGGGPGQAAGIKGQIVPHLFRHCGRGDDIGNGQPASRPQDPEGLAKHLELVRGKIDDAVGQDHVHAGVGYRQVLDFAQAEFDLGIARFSGIFPGPGHHLGGHVHPDDVPG